MEEHPSRDGLALVTGGGVRLGAAIARRLAKDGWKLALHTRKEGAAKALAMELAAEGHEAVLCHGDLDDADIGAELFAQIGRCTVLVNSAAAFAYDDIATMTAERMDGLY